MKKVMKAMSLALVVTLVFASSACKKSDKKETEKATETEAAQTTYPLEITDGYGTKVTIKEEPKKIVSCSPAMTEIVFSLGKGDCLVGRTALCNYPEEAANVVKYAGRWDLQLQIRTGGGVISNLLQKP